MSHDRLRKTRLPCAGCGLNPALCICALLPRLATATRLLLIIHHREVRRTTNTGLLAARALVNSATVVRGRVNEPLDLRDELKGDFENLVLAPGEGAVDLAEFRPTRPVRLIVADGNWRQAAKVPRREPLLRDLTRVALTRVNDGVRHLRAEHRPDGYSTLEAIARAFGHLEGAAVEGALLELYHAKLAATLAGRAGGA